MNEDLYAKFVYEFRNIEGVPATLVSVSGPLDYTDPDGENDDVKIVGACLARTLMASEFANGSAPEPIDILVAALLHHLGADEPAEADLIAALEAYKVAAT